jgi:hypothetical protein
MSNQPLQPKDNRIIWIVVSTIFLAVAFYFTFVLNNIAQGIIWFGAVFALFILLNNPKN